MTPFWFIWYDLSEYTEKGREVIRKWANVELNRPSDFSWWKFKNPSYRRNPNWTCSVEILNLKKNGCHTTTELCPSALSMLIYHSLFYTHPSASDFFYNNTCFVFYVKTSQWWSCTRNHWRHCSVDCGAEDWDTVEAKVSASSFSVENPIFCSRWIIS